MSLEHELADVQLYLIRLADVCGVDLPTVTAKKIELNAYKYPVEVCGEVGVDKQTSITYLPTYSILTLITDG